MSVNLAIDIGNSSTKIGLFVDSELEKDWVIESPSELTPILESHKPMQVIVSSVAAEASDWTALVKAERLIVLSSSTTLPFKNLYKTKSTLGLDRLAALAGAEKINPGKNNLVIDIGSCITYDLLDKSNNYHGGIISPGIDLRFKAMNDYTKRLPLITNYENPNLIGVSTEEAMTSGVINGITAELDGIISQYQTKWPDLEVIMCGRGLNCFESKLKAHIFASPKLVLIGLNRILEYNEQS